MRRLCLHCQAFHGARQCKVERPAQTEVVMQVQPADAYLAYSDQLQLHASGFVLRVCVCVC